MTTVPMTRRTVTDIAIEHLQRIAVRVGEGVWQLQAEIAGA